MEDLSKGFDKGLICPRCGHQMNILTHGTHRCPQCGFWRRIHV